MSSASEIDLLKLLGLSKNRMIELVSPIVSDFHDDGNFCEIFARICLSNLIEPGDGVSGRLVETVGAIGALTSIAMAKEMESSNPLTDLSRASGLSEQDLLSAHDRWMPRFESLAFRTSLEMASRFNLRILTPSSEEWPVGFIDLANHTPLVLFVKGKTLKNLLPGVAIVGSRAVTPYGRWVAKEFSEGLSDEGYSIVSGGAFGVDAVAHQVALAQGGFTVALMAGGLDRLYPRGNEGLLQEVAASGAIVSEVPPGVVPTKWRFLQRNRLIAAISQATLVAEAGYRSGSINTANHAALLGRTVAAIPGSIASSSSAGCHRLIAEQKACLVSSVDEFIALLNANNPDISSDLPVDNSITSEQTRVLDAIGRRGADESTISKRSGISLTWVMAALGELETEQLVFRNGTKWMRVSHSL